MKLFGTYRSQLGMTLIEILVVVFLIGMAASVAVMTLPERKDPLESRAEEMLNEFKQMRTAAILSGQPVGLYVTEDHVETKLWLDGSWRVQTVSDRLPFGTRISVEQNDRAAEANMPDTEGWPQLIFDPTGVMDPAQLRYQAPGRDVTIEIDRNGEVTLATD